MLVVAGSGCTATLPQETGFLDRVVVVDEAEYRYQVYVPRHYQESELWPVILSLHGGDARGADGIRPTERGLGTAIRRYPDRYPAIVVFPQAPVGGADWQDLAGRVALAALDATLDEFSTESSRVYLTGFSMGGNGSWYQLYHHAERFAAALVIAGHIGGQQYGFTSPYIPPDSAPDGYAAVAQRVSGVPTWIFHGDADPAVPVEQSRQMARALQALEADVQYTELPGVGHNAWDTAYGREDVAAWLFAQRRP